MSAVDRLDPRRFDAHAICDRLNDFSELSDEEQDQYLGIWDYAGLEDIGHPLGTLLSESHNGCYAVRDLDGRVKLIWEDARTQTWHVGDLSPAHLRTAELDEAIEYEGLALDADLVRAAIAEIGAYPTSE